MKTLHDCVKEIYENQEKLTKVVKESDTFKDSKMTNKFLADAIDDLCEHYRRENIVEADDTFDLECEDCADKDLEIERLESDIEDLQSDVNNYKLKYQEYKNKYESEKLKRKTLEAQLECNNK